MKKIIVYNLFFITAWFLVACASYEFPEELKILGYNPEDLISYRHLEKRLSKERFLKRFGKKLTNIRFFRPKNFWIIIFSIFRGIQSFNP